MCRKCGRFICSCDRFSSSLLNINYSSPQIDTRPLKLDLYLPRWEPLPVPPIEPLRGIYGQSIGYRDIMTNRTTLYGVPSACMPLPVPGYNPLPTPGFVGPPPMPPVFNPYCVG